MRGSGCWWVVALLGCGPGTGAQLGADAGGSSSDPADSGSETDDGPAGLECEGSAEVSLTARPPTVMFVVEDSEHMAATWDHDGDPATPTQTRWATASGLLLELQGATAGPRVCDAAFQAGLVLAPDPDFDIAWPDDGCDVSGEPEVWPVSFAAPDLFEALPAVDGLGRAPAPGFTTAWHALEGSLEPEETGMAVLVRHSPPVCGETVTRPTEMLNPYTKPIVAAMYASMGVRTMVIGVDVSTDPYPEADDLYPDGVSAHTYFNELALAGEIPRANGESERHYYVPGDPELASLLLALGPNPTVDCGVDLDEPPFELDDDPGNLRVWVNGTSVPEVSACADEPTSLGWVRVDAPQGSRLELCAGSCAALEAGECTDQPPYDKTARLRVAHGCPP